MRILKRLSFALTGMTLGWGGCLYFHGMVERPQFWLGVGAALWLLSVTGIGEWMRSYDKEASSE